KKETNFLEGKIEDLQSDLKDFQPARFLRVIQDTVGYLSNGEVPTSKSESMVSPIDLAEVVQKAQDIYKLGENSHRATEHYKLLSTKEGFDEHMADYIKALGQSSDKLGVDKDGKIVDARKYNPDSTA